MADHTGESRMAKGAEPRRDGVRWGRVVGAAVGIALAVFILLVLPSLVMMLPRPIRRAMTEWFLRGFLVLYVLVLAAAVPGAAILGWVVARGRRRGGRRPIGARLLLLCLGCLAGLVLVEASAVAWRAWVHRMPALPTRFAPAPADE